MALIEDQLNGGSSFPPQKPPGKYAPQKDTPVLHTRLLLVNPASPDVSDILRQIKKVLQTGEEIDFVAFSERTRQMVVREFRNLLTPRERNEVSGGLRSSTFLGRSIVAWKPEYDEYFK